MLSSWEVTRTQGRSWRIIAYPGATFCAFCAFCAFIEAHIVFHPPSKCSKFMSILEAHIISQTIISLRFQHLGILNFWIFRVLRLLSLPVWSESSQIECHFCNRVVLCCSAFQVPQWMPTLPYIIIPVAPVAPVPVLLHRALLAHLWRRGHQV